MITVLQFNEELKHIYRPLQDTYKVIQEIAKRKQIYLISLNEINYYINKTIGTLDKHINVLVALGLIDKYFNQLNPELTPPADRTLNYEWSARIEVLKSRIRKKKGYGGISDIGAYKLVELTDEVIATANRRAKLLLDNGYSLSIWGKQFLLSCSSRELRALADVIYPDDRDITEDTKKILVKLEYFISNYDLISPAELVAKVHRSKGYSKDKIMKVLKRNKYKLMKKYKLEYRQLSKEEQQRYQKHNRKYYFIKNTKEER